MAILQMVSTVLALGQRFISFLTWLKLPPKKDISLTSWLDKDLGPAPCKSVEVLALVPMGEIKHFIWVGPERCDLH